MRQIEQSPNHKWHCTAQALARVTVLSTGAFHEDVGFGDMANSPTRGAAIDKCMKEAVTDAVKRCLRYFGNSTGNCLYDNNYTREIVRHKDKNRVSDGIELYYNTNGLSSINTSLRKRTDQRSSIIALNTSKNKRDNGYYKNASNNSNNSNNTR